MLINPCCHLSGRRKGLIKLFVTVLAGVCCLVALPTTAAEAQSDPMLSAIGPVTRFMTRS